MKRTVCWIWALSMIFVAYWLNCPLNVKTCCSATFSDDIKSLAEKLLHNPLEIEVARRNTASEQVSQLVHFVDKKRKRELLSQMIGGVTGSRCWSLPVPNMVPTTWQNS